MITTPMGTIGTNRMIGSIDMKSETITEILQLYAEIDRDCSSFCLATGLRCLEGCGICCNSSNIEAQPLELLPAIVALYKRGEMEQWHARLSSGSVDLGLLGKEREGFLGSLSGKELSPKLAA